MELLQLKYFCDAAESENFSKTAKKYSVPPSDISRTILRLENELGVKLFEREANRLYLNEYGKKFHKGIKKALAEIETAKMSIYDSGEIDGEIKIYVCTNRSLITSVIEKFKGKFPKVSFIINHAWENENNDFDLLISDDMVAPADASRKLLLTEDVLLAVNKLEPGAEKINSVSDLRNMRFVTMQERSVNYRIMKHLCNQNGFEPNIAIQTDDPFYVRKYVELGMGVTFVPQFSWRGLLSENVLLKNITDFKRNTYVYINKGKYISRTVNVFLEELIKFCENIG